MFKDIKQNYPVYIFDKQTAEYMQGKVTSVSLPRYQREPSGIPMSSSVNNYMVVDVTIDAGGRTATYTIPENLCVTYAGSLVLSTELNGVLREIEAVNKEAEQALSEIDKKKEVKKRTSSLLVELNPTYREKKETEERFSKIENNVSEMKELLTNFIKEFKS